MGYYIFCFAVSLILSFIYLLKWDSRQLSLFSMAFIFITLGNFGYLMLANSRTIGEALIANKITYLSSCFGTLYVLFIAFRVCRIDIRAYHAAFFYAISSFVFGLSCTAGYSEIYYNSCSLAVVKGCTVINKTYGPMHFLSYVMLALYLVVGFVAILYSMKKKKDISRRNAEMMLGIETFIVFMFFFGRLFMTYDITPLLYNVILVVFLVLANRTTLYDVDKSVMGALTARGDLGVVSFSKSLVFAGCNDVAEKYYPELAKFRVDEHINPEDPDIQNFVESMKKLKESGSAVFRYSRDDVYYEVSGNQLFLGKKLLGYTFLIYDVTRNHESEIKFNEQAIVDDLTRLYNRRHYEEVLDDPQDADVLIFFDVNGLKSANDTYGHEAGDELLTGASECLRGAFENFGKCFRTGGDEFFAALKGDKATIKKATEKFDSLCENWKGEKIPSMHVSYGVVFKEDFEGLSFRELAREADKLMYKAKEEYYSGVDADRRKE